MFFGHFLKMGWIKLLGKFSIFYIIFSEVSLFYIDNADKNLLIFAMHNYNEVFLK